MSVFAIYGASRKVMEMSETLTTQLLTEIKAELVKIDEKLEDIKDGLATDRSWLWKVLMLTIGGSFALIGIKLAVP